MANACTSIGLHAGPDAAFLNDIWRLDVRTMGWSQVQPQGEELPRISRWVTLCVAHGC